MYSHTTFLHQQVCILTLHSQGNKKVGGKYVQNMHILRVTQKKYVFSHYFLTPASMCPCHVFLYGFMFDLVNAIISPGRTGMLSGGYH